MADNYIEKQYEDFQKRKAKEAEARRRRWQKQMKAYKDRLSKEKNDE